jgi:excisionase family DNA binding protein
MEQLLYSVQDAGKALGISRSNAWRLVQEGQLAAVKLGNRTLIPVTEIRRFAAELPPAQP